MEKSRKEKLQCLFIVVMTGYYNLYYLHWRSVHRHQSWNNLYVYIWVFCTVFLFIPTSASSCSIKWVHIALVDDKVLIKYLKINKTTVLFVPFHSNDAILPFESKFSTSRVISTLIIIQFYRSHNTIMFSYYTAR